MLFEDTFLSITAPSQAITKEKGSKFLAFAFPVHSEEQVKKHMAALRKEHPSANHHCYAYRLGADKLAFRSNDDGEPAGTAGRPILGQIQSKDLTNILIVVVRYFGGTLLGVSGLISAYRESAAAAIAAAEIVEQVVNEVYALHFEYARMNDVMRLVKEEDLRIISHQQELSSVMKVAVRKSKTVQVTDAISKFRDVKLVYVGVE